MAEEDFDSDTCLGFKRRISQLSEIESNQQTVQGQHSNSHSLTPGLHSFEIVSSAKEERETERNSPVFASESLNGLLKKAKCTSPGDSEANIGVQETQETEEDKLGLGNDDVDFSVAGEKGDGVVGESGSWLLSEKGKESKNCEVEFSGNREFVEVKKSASSLLSVREVQMHPAVADWNTGLATSCVSFDEIESKSFLKNKDEQCLVESVLESIADATTHASIVNDFVGKREIMGDTIKIKEEIDNFSWVDGTLGTVEIPDTDEMGSACEGMGKMVESDGEKLDYPTGNGETMKCSLKIEVIDETAVIETTSASNIGIGIGREKGFVGFAKHSETNGHKNIMKQETDGKKEKRPRRRGKGARKLSGTNGKEKILTHTAEAQNSCTKKGDETKRAYLREEMEALRFVSLEAQRKKWSEVYCGLTPAVAREYDGLINCNHQNHIHFNFDPRQQFGKKEKTPGVLGEDFQVVDNEIENMNPLDPACGLSGNGEDDHTVVEGECSEEDDSDADYSSIQRPAFVVTGEPNFDSGPPLDGLEYLRRVRWEAAQIPKVKVAKLESSKLTKEQTVYMPKIPDIAKCPEHLLPLKQWEDAFIADFSELRLAFSRLEGCSAEISAKFQFSSTVYGESSNQQLERIIVEKFDNLTTDGVESYEAVDLLTPENSSDPRSFSIVDANIASPSGSSPDSPTLSVILKMDSVARLSILKKRIRLVENMSTLSRNDCAWLFALCAAIDTPLDADTCAALRCLLRKSASLRAEKSELDDEVVMLNILGTITGKFFGQSEY